MLETALTEFHAEFHIVDIIYRYFESIDDARIKGILKVCV